MFWPIPILRWHCVTSLWKDQYLKRNLIKIEGWKRSWGTASHSKDIRQQNEVWVRGYSVSSHTVPFRGEALIVVSPFWKETARHSAWQKKVTLMSIEVKVAQNRIFCGLNSDSVFQLCVNYFFHRMQSNVSVSIQEFPVIWKTQTRVL